MNSTRFSRARLLLSLMSASCGLLIGAQKAAGEQRVGSLPESGSNHPAYPLVIRIDHTALATLDASSVDDRRGVDRVVLGTHVVGESRTTGAVTSRMVPNSNAASFDLSFRGRMLVSTVGTNGPALIYSHSDTDFLYTRQISFDPRQGFVSGARTFDADTRLVYDGFDSSRGQLGRRLIIRIAARRACASREEARQIADRDAGHDLRQAFDERLDAQLAKMNKTANVVGLVKRLMTGGSSMQLSARSTEDCVYVGLGSEGGSAKLTATPPRCPTATPIEIGIFSALLNGQLAKLQSVSKNNLLSQPSRREILRALLIPEEEAVGITDIGLQEGWLVLGLQSPVPTSSLVRRWTDVSGRYHVEAAFVELSGDSVRLKQADGRRMYIGLAQLSAKDQQFVRLMQAKTSDTAALPNISGGK